MYNYEDVEVANMSKIEPVNSKLNHTVSVINQDTTML
jgi:hypothetical protein